MATTNETLLKQLEPLRKDDATLNYMMVHKLPLTREHYISMAYGGNPPERWTHEHEAEIPEPLRDPSKVPE